MKDSLIYEINGKEDCDEEGILAILLKENLVFCNSRKYVCCIDQQPKDETIVLFLLCNDIFAWGCADAESFTTTDILPIYKLYLENKIWGVAKWCCLKRNQKPQKPVADAMKESGVWDEKLDALPENHYDLAWKEHFKKKDEQKTIS